MSKALWRGPVVSCCGGLAVMAQEAKSWDPGSIPGRDTSFDVPEFSCLLSGPGLQPDSRYTWKLDNVDVLPSQLNFVISLLPQGCCGSVELQHQCHFQLVFEDPLLLGTKDCRRWWKKALCSWRNVIAIMTLAAFFHVGRPSCTLHYSMWSSRLWAGSHSWWRLYRQQALASTSGSSHRSQTPVKHAVDITYGVGLVSLAWRSRGQHSSTCRLENSHDWVRKDLHLRMNRPLKIRWLLLAYDFSSSSQLCWTVKDVQMAHSKGRMSPKSGIWYWHSCTQEMLHHRVVLKLSQSRWCWSGLACHRRQFSSHSWDPCEQGNPLLCLWFTSCPTIMWAT